MKGDIQMETKELCGSCATKLGTGFAIRKVAGGVDHKVTCAECGKRRYGGTYEAGSTRRKATRHEG